MDDDAVPREAFALVRYAVGIFVTGETVGLMGAVAEGFVLGATTAAQGDITGDFVLGSVCIADQDGQICAQIWAVGEWFDRLFLCRCHESLLWMCLTRGVMPCVAVVYRRENAVLTPKPM
mgnify:CR=1 FL=1